MVDKPLLFSTKKYEYMAGDMRGDLAYNGILERKEFPDGEHYHRISTDVERNHVILLGGTVSDADTLEIYDLACGMVKYGARRLDLVIPYFGYSTMERAVKFGEIVTAKTRARLFSAIPTAPEGNRVFLLDIHSEGIPHYFEGNIRPVHVYAKEATKQLISEFGGKDYILASTDAGRAKWVESLANELNVPASFIFKKREGNDIKVSKISLSSSEVAGKTVVIYDDMLRTGGSMLAAVRTYRAAGAAKIYVVVTHGVMGSGFDYIKNMIDGAGCTDSHPAIGWGRSSCDMPGFVFHKHKIGAMLMKKVLDTP